MPETDDGMVPCRFYGGPHDGRTMRIPDWYRGSEFTMPDAIGAVDRNPTNPRIEAEDLCEVYLVDEDEQGFVGRYQGRRSA